MFDHKVRNAAQLCKTEARLSVLIALLGGFAYFMISDPFGLILIHNYFGHQIYDYYLQSLLEGRFDVPIRIVSFEGHYTPSGKAFVYHGLAPLVPRAILTLFIDLGTINSNRWVIFGCTTGAVAIFHYTVFRILRHVCEPSEERMRWIALTGVMCWVGTAGPVIVSNSSIYNESFATALLALSGAGYIFARLIVFHDALSKWLVGMAACITIAIHSRSTIAFGLCLSFGLLWLLCLFQTRLAQIRPLILSALVACVGLGVLLVSNHARFGDMTQMHGSFDPERDDLVQHAVVYWGLWEKSGVDYTENFIKHGTFNIGRLPGNAMMQVFGMPAKATPQVEIYKSMVSAYGTPRIWGPHGGIFFLWMPWIVIVLFALQGRKTASHAIKPGIFAIAALGTLATAVLVLSFASLHFRYRVDLWPLVSVLSIASLPVLLHRDQSAKRRQRAYTLAFVATIFAIAFSGFSALRHTSENIDQTYRTKDHVFGVWSRELCLQMLTEKGLPEAQYDDLCDLS